MSLSTGLCYVPPPPHPPVFRKMRFVENIGTVEKIAFFYWSLINDLQHPNFPQKL